jgi:hypothetical protein
MTLYQFKSKNETEQTDIIGSKGELIAEREEKFCTIHLYQVGSFYVEVYHHNHFNVVIRVKSFKDLKQLDPYLQQINIDEILSIL